MKFKFTLIDYIIIVLVICAIIFAFIHITTDDSSDLQKTAFDSSTINKIPETYSNYYKDGYIVKSTVEGFNSTNGEKVTLNGTVDWINDNGGSDVDILIDSNNKTYLVGLYPYVPNADIYIDTISLESNGDKYDNLVEFSVKPMKINSLNDLTKNLSDADFEISTVIALDSLDSIKLQEITNNLNSNSKKIAIQIADENSQNHIKIKNADSDCINDANSILGNINGLTDDITIRVYNCRDSQIDNIKNNYEVTNIRTF